MKIIYTFLLVIFVTLNFAETSKYAGEIYQIAPSAKNLALGHTGTTDDESTSLSYLNPALIGINNQKQIEFMHSENFSGLLTNDVFSYKHNNLFSLVLSRVAIEDVQITEQDSPTVIKKVTNSDYILNIGLSRLVFNANLGLNVKTIFRSLSENTGWGFGADLAFFKDLNGNIRLGTNLRNIIPTMTLWENGTKETVPVSIDSEIRFKFLAPIISKPTKLYLAFEGYTEGRDYSAKLNIGKFSLDPKLGVDLEIFDNISILGGYYYENLTAGLSASYRQFTLFYAFETSKDLENSHRISIQMKLGN